jgi:hypothetical protein
MQAGWKIVALASWVLWTACIVDSQGPIQQRTQDSGNATRRDDPPPIPVEEIIQKFAKKETEFREARGNYTYTQTVLVQEFESDGRPGGEFRRTSEIIFTPEGRRYEKITHAPPSTLELISMSLEDLKDLENIQPFVLTTDELPKYHLEYAGREQIDEIAAYVFHVRPRKLVPGERYFEGTIWVEEKDLQIVKSFGKAVPDLRRGDQENLFPKFETYRENIDGDYWFPTYTRADDVLRFKRSSVRIRMVVRYQNYQRFGSTIRIVPVEGDVKKPPQPRD